MKLSEFSRIVNGCFVGEDMEFRGIRTDSRKINAGDIFVALKGSRFDGHEFVEDALQKGAVASLVERPVKGNYIIVGKVEDALLRWASYIRGNFYGTVVGVLGAVGKTTTKSMLAKVLGNFYKILYSPKSYNNFIGVPLTINESQLDEEFWIIEMGTNRPGEIRKLSKVVLPNDVIFTRLGPEHLEGFKTTFNAIMEEYSVLEYTDGLVLVNSESPFFPNRKHYKYGFKEGDFVGKNLSISEEGVRYTFEGVEFFVPYPHIGFAENSLAVASFCKILGLPLNEVSDILRDFKGEPMRMEVLKCDGKTVINDSYNSNPISVDMLLRSIHDIYKGRRLVFVFGDMLELGEESEYWHRWVGERLDRFGISCVVGFGRYSKFVLEEASKRGIITYHARDHVDIVDFLESDDWDVIIVKGSRAMMMEKVVEMLCSKST